MRRLCALAAVLALLLGFGAPAPAAATGGALPPLRLITSARFEQAILSNGRVVAVGRGFKESRDRIYMTVQDYRTGATSELVLYDGVAYTRVNDEREWRPGSVTTIRLLVPTADLLLLFDGPLTSLGTTQIGGADADHYQIWGDGVTADPAQDGFVKLDFFVGPQSRYLYQFQFERTVVDPDGSTRLVAATVRYFDHDDPALKVVPPR